MKFYCQRFPYLHVKLAKDTYVVFQNGVFETSDPKLEELLRKHKWFGSIITEGKKATWIEEAVKPQKEQPIQEEVSESEEEISEESEPLSPPQPLELDIPKKKKGKKKLKKVSAFTAEDEEYLHLS